MIAEYPLAGMTREGLKNAGLGKMPGDFQLPFCPMGKRFRALARHCNRDSHERLVRCGFIPRFISAPYGPERNALAPGAQDLDLAHWTRHET